jgi:hypothetical protein
MSSPPQADKNFLSCLSCLSMLILKNLSMRQHNSRMRLFGIPGAHRLCRAQDVLPECALRKKNPPEAD